MNKWDENETNRDKVVEELKAIVEATRETVVTTMKAVKDLKLEYEIIVNKYNLVMQLLEQQGVTADIQNTFNNTQVAIVDELEKKVRALEDARDNKA